MNFPFFPSYIFSRNYSFFVEKVKLSQSPQSCLNPEIPSATFPKTEAISSCTHDCHSETQATPSRAAVNGTLNQLQKTQGLIISLHKQWGIQSTHWEHCSYSCPITSKQTHQPVFYQELTSHLHIWQKTPVQYISKNTSQTKLVSKN